MREKLYAINYVLFMRHKVHIARIYNVARVDRDYVDHIIDRTVEAVVDLLLCVIGVMIGARLCWLDAVPVY